MNISCNIVPYTMVECLCAGKPQHDPGQCCPTGQPGQGSGPPPLHCLFISHWCQLSSGVYGEVLWDAVLTCLKLSPGTPESTLISGQCTLVCCCSSVLQQSEGHSLECWGFSDVWRWIWRHGSRRIGTGICSSGWQASRHWCRARPAPGPARRRPWHP